MRGALVRRQESLEEGGNLDANARRDEAETGAGDAASRQGACGSHRELEGAGRTLPWGLQGEGGPADTLILDFWFQMVRE